MMAKQYGRAFGGNAWHVITDDRKNGVRLAKCGYTPKRGWAEVKTEEPAVLSTCTICFDKEHA